MSILSEKEIKFGFTYYHCNDPHLKELSSYQNMMVRIHPLRLIAPNLVCLNMTNLKTGKEFWQNGVLF
ncbi:hypothetical protein D3C72_1305280 [compost metagenome]